MTSFKLFANLSNGKQQQVQVFVNSSEKYFSFIENYNGNDLGNEIILQDFVTNAIPLNVIIG